MSTKAHVPVVNGETCAERGSEELAGSLRPGWRDPAQPARTCLSPDSDTQSGSMALLKSLFGIYHS